MRKAPHVRPHQAVVAPSPRACAWPPSCRPCPDVRSPHAPSKSWPPALAGRRDGRLTRIDDILLPGYFRGAENLHPTASWLGRARDGHGRATSFDLPSAWHVQRPEQEVGLPIRHHARTTCSSPDRGPTHHLSPSHRCYGDLGVMHHHPSRRARAPPPHAFPGLSDHLWSGRAWPGLHSRGRPECQRVACTATPRRSSHAAPAAEEEHLATPWGTCCSVWVTCKRNEGVPA